MTYLLSIWFYSHHYVACMYDIVCMYLCIIIYYIQYNMNMCVYNFMHMY
jgi:hypothetical protein